MGDFKGLADKLKVKENKYIMEARKLKIGKGVISYDENILIPLDAISFVEIPEQEQNGQDSYELKIQNHAGTCFYITAPDMGFIREIRSALMICMNDRSAVYSGRERAVVTGGDKVYGDKIISAGDIHIESTGHSRTAVVKEKNTGATETITILEDEWKLLKDYALQRMKDFPKNDRNHTICEALAASAELKNREKCKMILDVSGNNALDMIIVGAPIAIKAVVNKIM
ncbi:MAG: hypothetical protein K2L82_02945 [Lachnospiraceae bacterium]|nr:hypothetical protein [Lachnospiraceae bacterium]